MMKFTLITLIVVLGLAESWPHFYFCDRSDLNCSLLVNASIEGYEFEQYEMKSSYIINDSFLNFNLRSLFNKSKETIFVVHGFMDNITEPYIVTLKNSLLQLVRFIEGRISKCTVNLSNSFICLQDGF